MGLSRPLFRGRAVSSAAHEWYAVALVALTLFHCWLAAYLPPAEDELYYWTWAQHWHGSYFDHPPMVAYLISFSTALFGDTLFGIRFFAIIAATAVLGLIGRLMPQKDLLTYLLASPIFLLGSVLMTPDVPLVFFWTCYVLWLVGVNETLSHWSNDPVTRVYRSTPFGPVGVARWIAGGVLLGLGGLSKYTMVLAVPCTLLVLVARTRPRAWLLGFAVHLAVAGLVTLPILAFNRAHDFIPLAFQWNHAMGGGASPSFFGFVGTQVLLIGALPFLILPWVVARTGFLLSDPRSQVSYFFFVVPALFFLFQALRGPLEANWALVAYVTCWPLAQRLLQQNSFKTLGRGLTFLSFVVPAVVSGGLLVHAISPLALIPPAKDRLGQMQARYLLSRQVARDVTTIPESGGRVFAPNYQWASYFRFQKLDATQLPGVGRLSQFTLEPANACREKSVLVWEPSGMNLPSLGCFPRRDVLREYGLSIRGVRTESFSLVRYRR